MQLRSSTRSLTLGLLGRDLCRNCNASHLTSTLTREFHSGSFNITLFLPFRFSLVLSQLHLRSLTHLLCNSLIRTSRHCLTEEWITWHAHTPLRLSISNMHVHAHMYVCVCVARESFNLLSRSMTVHGNLLIHSVARDRRRLVANKISPSLRHRLLLPSSAFTRCAHYETCYIALHYGYIRSSASCLVIMSNSR